MLLSHRLTSRCGSVVDPRERDQLFILRENQMRGSRSVGPLRSWVFKLKSALGEMFWSQRQFGIEDVKLPEWQALEGMEHHSSSRRDSRISRVDLNCSLFTRDSDTVPRDAQSGKG